MEHIIKSLNFDKTELFEPKKDNKKLKKLLYKKSRAKEHNKKAKKLQSMWRKAEGKEKEHLAFVLKQGALDIIYDYKMLNAEIAKARGDNYWIYINDPVNTYRIKNTTLLKQKYPSEYLLKRMRTKINKQLRIYHDKIDDQVPLTVDEENGMKGMIGMKNLIKLNLEYVRSNYTDWDEYVEKYARPNMEYYEYDDILQYSQDIKNWDEKSKKIYPIVLFTNDISIEISMANG